MTYTLAQIAQLVRGTVEGNPDSVVTDLAEIQHAEAGQLTFLSNPKYAKYVPETRATAILVERDFNGHFPNLIRVADPYLAFSRLIPKFRPPLPLPEPGIASSAEIADSVQLGEGCHIGPNVIIKSNCNIGNHVTLLGNNYIGRFTEIGDNTLIFPNVSIYHRCKIGKNVRIHAGTVIGSDGFGFVRTTEGISKIPQEGGVEIGDDVEIGSNSSIDRGTLANTVIGKGTKLDNLIQIAHNVKIGEYCFIAAMSGIAGSTRIGNYVTIAAQVGIAGHLHVGDGAIIAAQSGISKDVPPNTIMFGYPAQEQSKARREIAHIRSLPDLKTRIKQMENDIDLLKQRNHYAQKPTHHQK